MAVHPRDDSPAARARRLTWAQLLHRVLEMVAMKRFPAALIAVLLDGQASRLRGAWERCLSMGLGAAALSVVVVGLVAVRVRERLSAGSLAALAAGGAPCADLEATRLIKRVTRH